MSSLADACSIHLATPSVSSEFVSPRVTPHSRGGAGEELRSAIATTTCWNDWLHRCAALSIETVSAAGVLIWEPASGVQPDRLSGLTFPVQGLSENLKQTLQTAAKQVRDTRRVQFFPIAGSRHEHIAAVTLSRRDTTAGVLLLLLSADAVESDAASSWCALLATCTELWAARHDGSGTPTATLPNPTAQHHGNTSRAKLSSRTRRIALGAVAAAAAMFVPVPYHVNCDCELQPITRRFVAAPFEGLLERAFVDVGDTVTAGQLLARMDGKEVRWELAGNQAEYERAAKERDAHLADQDFGEAQLSKLQMERLALTTKLLENRNANLEIRSPVDGIVVSGEQKRAEGVRLAMGQSLFEIAPLDRMIVEVQIPEAELAHVPRDASASIRLESFPNQSLAGPLQRICPRAELKNQQQVFVAEIPLPNDGGQLRPGMRGKVHIRSGTVALGWRLFHRAWDKLRLW